MSPTLIAPDPDDTVAASKAPFMWRCTRCQRRETFGSDALGRFLDEGWPACCGEIVMGFLQPREP